MSAVAAELVDVTVEDHARSRACAGTRTDNVLSDLCAVHVRNLEVHSAELSAVGTAPPWDLRYGGVLRPVDLPRGYHTVTPDRRRRSIPGAGQVGAADTR